MKQFEVTTAAPKWLSRIYRLSARSREEAVVLAEAARMGDPVSESLTEWVIPQTRVESVIEVPEDSGIPESREQNAAYGTGRRGGSLAVDHRLRSGDFLADRFLHRLAGWSDVLAIQIRDIESLDQSQENPRAQDRLLSLRNTRGRIAKAMNAIQETGLDSTSDRLLLSSCTKILAPLAAYLQRIDSPLYKSLVGQLDEIRAMLVNGDLKSSTKNEEEEASAATTG